MSRRHKQLAGWLVFLAVALCLQSVPSYAGVSGKTDKKPASKKTVKRSTHRRRVVRRRRRRSSFRYRLARLRPSSERITEIQQALIREGYLKQEATGRWDGATRTAMRTYQEENGFKVTGLPEAKTLMKLGLGPHPLPEEVDPTVAGRAGINSPDKDSSSSQSNSSSPQGDSSDRK